MKHYLCFLILSPALFFGQSADQNYIKTTTYKIATTTSIASPTAAQAAITVSYFDGLGRPSQQVANKQSTSGGDIITHVDYDAFNRQVNDYLPYVRQTASLDFDPAGKASTENFYQTNVLANTGNPNFEVTTNPKSEKLFEASPLNRVLKQAAPGNDWAMGLGHEVKMDYQANAANDEVVMLTATATPDAYGAYGIVLNSSAYYPANTLYKTITYDENSGLNPVEANGSTVEFKDVEGRVVLKRTYSLSMVGTTEINDAHDTYYVYDQYGNLTYVIPPVAAVSVSGGVSATDLEKYCYQYKYDNRNRMAEKKLPGRQWEFMVYDKLDRVVATGPAAGPFSDKATSSGWLVSKYDAFGRNIMTGWMETATPFTSAARQALQQIYDGQTVQSETKRTDGINTTVGGIAFRYTNTTYPTAGYHVLTINYFDDYIYPEAPNIPGVSENQPVFYNNTVKPIGLPTCSYRRVLQASTNTNRDMTIDFYDYKGRVIRSFTRSYIAGGYQQEDTKYDFVKVIMRVHRHNRNTTVAELHTREFLTYSAQDRVIRHSYAINSSVETGAQLMAINTYDNLGQLLTKKTGGTDLTGATYYQKTDYSYNIRGWLKTINNIDDLADGTRPDLFAFKLNYNTTEDMTGYQGTALYNGNISETIWNTGSDNTKRKYGYFYDGLNRLKNAVYMKPVLNGTVGHSYDETVHYDKHGNITNLVRNGVIDDNPSTIQTDNLQYAYDGNRLMKVTDNSNNDVGFRDDKTTDPTDAADDYGYDDYGNMKRDDNKGITNITYNHLNLPVKLTFANGGIIEYLYDAAGTKLKKTVMDSGVVTTTDYLWGYQYEDGVLQFFPTSEGYVSNVVANNTNNYNYVFTFKDHLGNNRVSYGMDPSDNTLKIMSDDNYYPFGERHTGYNWTKRTFQAYKDSMSGTGFMITTPPPAYPDGDYMYKYNGKELQDELGLNMYDYGARLYDPAIGRWMNIDNFADIYVSESQYNYALNNPVKNLDAGGNFVISQEFATRYPNITFYIRNFMECDVMGSKKIVQALMDLSRPDGRSGKATLTKQRLLDALTDGKGPRLSSADDVAKPGDPFGEQANGSYDEITDIILLNNKVLSNLESTLESKNNLDSDSKSFALMAAYMLILHETGHWSDWLDGKKNNNMEAGVVLENKVWLQDSRNSKQDINDNKLIYDNQCQIKIDRFGENVFPTMFTTFPANSNNKSKEKEVHRSSRYF